MDNQQSKKVETPLWKKPIIIVYALIALAALAVVVYISLIFNLSPTINALIGAVIAGIIGLIAPRQSHEERAGKQQGGKDKR